jgi:hypothetical protein
VSSLLKKVVDLIYKVYYRVCYYPYALWVTYHPIRVYPPDNAQLCEFIFDEGCFGQSHHNFLLVPIPAENRWSFWKRHFAVTTNNQHSWYSIPSLTPWSTEIDGRQKYGLNSRFVNLYINQDPDDFYPIFFRTWK